MTVWLSTRTCPEPLHLRPPIPCPRARRCFAVIQVLVAALPGRFHGNFQTSAQAGVHRRLLCRRRRRIASISRTTGSSLPVGPTSPSESQKDTIKKTDPSLLLSAWRTTTAGQCGEPPLLPRSRLICATVMLAHTMMLPHRLATSYCIPPSRNRSPAPRQTVSGSASWSASGSGICLGGGDATWKGEATPHLGRILVPVLVLDGDFMLLLTLSATPPRR
mmetsp:Transcript_28028/g.64631  ORF Transcript_28028/g.64631 Transcript_28028/m.64631 type:complete len:219 (+) Transcript_28028:1858-2514(+)